MSKQVKNKVAVLAFFDHQIAQVPGIRTIEQPRYTANKEKL